MDEADMCINYVKLHKLLYFCQGYHMAKHNRPLFDEKILAWPCGPAIAEIKDRYELLAFENLYYTDKTESELNDEEKATINNIIELKGAEKKDNLTKEAKLHIMYDDVYRQWRDDPNASNVIELERIKAYFIEHYSNWIAQDNI